MARSPDNQTVLCQMANCAFAVVSNLLSRDQLLAKELRSSETASRQIFREECITLEMAAALKEKFPAHIDLTIFTSAEEARNGADWYWRIQKGEGAIHARVQAKRVRRSEFGQSDFDGVVNFETGQLRKLVQDVNSSQSSLPQLQAWIATFARYDALPPCAKDPSNCEKHRCEGNCCGINVLPSVWISQAQEFVGSRSSSQSINIRKVIENSLRLDCVLPCIDFERGTGPAIKGCILSAGLPPFDDCVAAVQSDPALNAAFQGALQIRV